MFTLLLASAARAQSCVNLTLLGSFPDPMPLTNPITQVTIPVQIDASTCSQTLYYGVPKWSGRESQDDTRYAANGCTTIAPGTTCNGLLTAFADLPDDPNICQPANAKSESFCSDTLTLAFCFSKPCTASNTQLPSPVLVFNWTVDNPKVQGSIQPATFNFTGAVGQQTADQTITVTNSATCGHDCTGVIQVGQISVPANIFIDQDNCSNQSIPENQTCTVTVYAVPQSTKIAQGNILVPNNLGHNGRSQIHVVIN